MSIFNDLYTHFNLVATTPVSRYTGLVTVINLFTPSHSYTSHWRRKAKHITTRKYGNCDAMQPEIVPVVLDCIWRNLYCPCARAAISELLIKILTHTSGGIITTKYVYLPAMLIILWKPPYAFSACGFRPTPSAGSSEWPWPTPDGCTQLLANIIDRAARQCPFWKRRKTHRLWRDKNELGF